MTHPRRSLALLLITFALVACARPPWPAALVPTATPAPSATAAPTATAAPSATAAPTATSAPTATAAPSATPAPPTATFEPLAPTPTLPPLAAEERSKIFERVWSIVRDTYVYEDYRGVDWEAVREEFAPRVATAETPEAFYGLMRELIERLGDDHSRFESPQEVAAQEAEFEGDARYGGIGAQIRDVEEGGLVTSLVPGGPAERAGIGRHDLIVAVNGIPFIDSEAFGPDGPIGMVRGEIGTPVRLTVRSGDGPPREVVVVREPIELAAFNEVRARMLPDGAAGLIEIPTFYVDELDVKVRAAVEGLLAAGPLHGLIIDVRSNAGGYVHLMRNTIALFHDGGSIGSTSGRSISEEQEIPAGATVAGLAGVPIVVLVGPDTVSAAEMFAAGMQTLGRARVVGTASAGNTENLYSYSFDDGSRLLLATVAYRLPDGALIEGRGVQPDSVVDVDWWRYPAEQDPQLLAALAEIAAISAATIPQ
jgi:carboxyl-terminal processing protease